MRSATFMLLMLLGTAAPVRAQLREHVKLDYLNRHLAGQVVDYTANHGDDHRIYSPILGSPRDLYVYLPPGYSPANAYPLLVYLPMAATDEHAFLGPSRLKVLDAMMTRGEFPQTVVACPDGVISGNNRYREPHSLYVNGIHGRFQDHLVQEVIPFVTQNYSIRPERGAHGVLGVSAGAFGGMGVALKHRDFFGTVAILAGPLNMRYTNVDGRYRENFNPGTFRWKSTYDPNEIVGRFYLGLSRVPARKYIEPVFGNDGAVAARIAEENPADLLLSTNLQPGELAIYINYPSHDNWNFDAHAESFAWLAQQRGIAVELERSPCGQHNLPYFRPNHVRAYRWLASHLLPPAAVAQNAGVTPAVAAQPPASPTR